MFLELFREIALAVGEVLAGKGDDLFRAQILEINLAFQRARQPRYERRRQRRRCQAG